MPAPDRIGDGKQMDKEYAARAREITEPDSNMGEEALVKEQEETIEQTFEELERILEILGNDEQPLEEAFRYFEHGMKLVKSCALRLDQVEKQILVLNEGEEESGF